jgi:hypothetical protein
MNSDKSSSSVTSQSSRNRRQQDSHLLKAAMHRCMGARIIAIHSKVILRYFYLCTFKITAERPRVNVHTVSCADQTTCYCGVHRMLDHVCPSKGKKLRCNLVKYKDEASSDALHRGHGNRSPRPILVTTTITRVKSGIC